MKSDRPINLNLLAFSFPLAAMASITHRITGVALFAGFGFLLYLLDMALSSPAGFLAAQHILAQTWAKLIVLAMLAALGYHWLAGVKHLLLDLHVGDTVPAAKLGAQIVIVLTVAFTAAMGVWLW